MTNFKEKKPTEPGYYLWSPHDGSIQFVEVFYSKTGHNDKLIVVGGSTGNKAVDLVGGKWSNKARFD